MLHVVEACAISTGSRVTFVVRTTYDVGCRGPNLSKNLKRFRNGPFVGHTMLAAGCEASRKRSVAALACIKEWLIVWNRARK
jgi:hypothetical protein